MKKSKGWRNEPLRHSLASKGVKTGRGVHGRADRLSKHPTIKYRGKFEDDLEKIRVKNGWTRKEFKKVLAGYYDFGLGTEKTYLEDKINKKQGKIVVKDYGKYFSKVEDTDADLRFLRFDDELSKQDFLLKIKGYVLK